jgi:hypothetical protein
MQLASSLLIFDDMARGIAGDRRLCVPMMPSETIRMQTAVLMADACDRTVRGWCHADGIGRQSGTGRGARLHISAPALLMRAEGEFEILERLRNCERHHPHVEHFLRKSISWLEEARRNSDLAIPSRL